MQPILWFMHIFHPCMSSSQNIQIKFIDQYPIIFYNTKLCRGFFGGCFMEASEYINLKYNFCNLALFMSCPCLMFSMYE
jgi:hypothetical protein